jgi:hypothetical protein
MDWSKQKSNDEIIAFINSSPKCIKVLAAENMKVNDLEVRCEGVFVYCLDGDSDNGIGILLSNVVTINFPVNRGDIVHYRTINPDQKPYITLGISGKGN